MLCSVRDLPVHAPQNYFVDRKPIERGEVVCPKMPLCGNACSNLSLPYFSSVSIKDMSAAESEREARSPCSWVLTSG